MRELRTEYNIKLFEIQCTAIGILDAKYRQVLATLAILQHLHKKKVSYCSTTTNITNKQDLVLLDQVNNVSGTCAMC